MATYICGLETECSSSGVANKYATKARVVALGKSIRSDSIHTYTDAQIVAKRDIITKTETLYSDVSVGTASLNTAGDIPASGGSNYAKATVTYKQYTRTTYADGSYTDGTKSSKSATITGSTFTGSDLGTTLKVRTSLGTSTPSGTVAGATRTATGIAVYQAANLVTKVVAGSTSGYSTHVTYADITAGGTSSSPTGHGQATYTFTSGSTSTSSSTSPSFGGTATYTRTYAEKTDASNVFTVNTSTGAVTTSARGTTIGNARSVTVTATLVVKYTHTSTYGGGSVSSEQISADVTCTQAANRITKVEVTTSLSYSAIGAGSTSASPTRSASVSKYTFTSGSTSTSTPGSTYGTLTGPSYSYKLSASQNGFTAVNATSGVLTATSRGTTYGASARASGTVTQTATYTWTHSSTYGSGAVSGNATATATCSQNANTIDLTSTPSGGALTNPATYSAAGATKSVANKTAASITVTGKFKSGSDATSGTHFTVSGPTYSWTSNQTYATLTSSNAASLDVKMNSRGTENNANTRSATIRRTASFAVSFASGYGGSGNGTKTAYCEATVTQSGNVINYTLSSLTCTYSPIDWKGGNSTPSVSYSITRKWSSGDSAGANITSGGTLSFTGTVQNSSGATIDTTNGQVVRGRINSSTSALVVMAVVPSVTYGGTKMTGSSVNVSQNKIAAGLDIKVTNNSGAGAAIVYLISSSSAKPAYNASGWTYNSANIALNATTIVYANIGTGVLTPYYVNLKYITSSNWGSGNTQASGTIAQFKISDYLHYADTINTSAFASTTAKVPANKGYINSSGSIVVY